MGLDDQKIAKINLQGIDWNKLTPEEFSRLSKEMDARDADLKKMKPRKKRITNEEVPFTISGEVYLVRMGVIEKYKKMKSEKSRSKLLKSICETCTKVEKL